MQQALFPDAALTAVGHRSRLSVPPGSVWADEGVAVFFTGKTRALLKAEAKKGKKNKNK